MIVKCSNCGKEINKKPAHIKQYKNLFCCKKCSNEFKARNQVIKPCSYCGKEVKRSKSEVDKSKNGNIFCNRSCATSYNNRKYKSRESNPNWVDGKGSYRSIALGIKENKCEICGYDTIPEILQVHHKDCNKSNNVLENLQVLCPNCHAEVHWGPEGTERKTE